MPASAKDAAPASAPAAAAASAKDAATAPAPAATAASSKDAAPASAQTAAPTSDKDAVPASAKDAAAASPQTAAPASAKDAAPASAPAAAPASAKDAEAAAAGLTSEEARRRLEKFGPNSVADTSVHPLRRALSQFWAPVPWMLEAAIVLEVVMGNYVEAAIIALLLVFNAALGFFQEGRAQATLAALQSRLALNAAVCRDHVWKLSLIHI